MRSAAISFLLAALFSLSACSAISSNDLRQLREYFAKQRREEPAWDCKELHWYLNETRNWVSSNAHVTTIHPNAVAYYEEMNRHYRYLKKLDYFTCTDDHHGTRRTYRSHGVQDEVENLRREIGIERDERRHGELIDAIRDSN